MRLSTPAYFFFFIALNISHSFLHPLFTRKKEPAGPPEAPRSRLRWFAVVVLKSIAIGGVFFYATFYQTKLLILFFFLHGGLSEIYCRELRTTSRQLVAARTIMFIASFSLLALHIWPFKQIGSPTPLYFLFAIGFIIGALVPVSDEPKRNLLLLYDLIPPIITATVTFNTSTEAYNFGLYHYLWWALYPYRNLLTPNTPTRFPIRYTVTTAVALALFSTLPSYAPFIYKHFSTYSGQYANGHILLTMMLSEANPQFMKDFFTIGQMKPRQT